MDWTGAANSPTISAGANILQIYGSLTLIPAMTFSFGNVYFEATSPGQTITMGGQFFTQNVYFEGAGGGWTFLDAFKCSGNLTLIRGSINTNDQTVTAYSFYSLYSNPRSVTLGSSVLDLTHWQMLHVNASFNGGTATMNLKANFEADGMVTENYYDVNFTSAASATTWGLGGHGGTIQFRNVTFAGSGKLMGNNVFNTLTVAAGKTYELQDGKTQTIGSAFNAAGTCNTVINIRSNTPGTQATISKSTGTVTVDYVSLKDIRATGGAVFTANNATNLGNNTGWTINTVSPQNLYWVGGSGNWNDQGHWSTTSGGAGGACIPTAYDDVFFDGGSGFTAGNKTVTINVTANCRSMDWTGALNNPILTGSGANTLQIYGSLKMIPAMSFPFGAGVYFEATSLGHTITMGGQFFNSNVYFEGAGGGWTFLDAFKCGGAINLVNGSINTNDQTVTAYTFYSLNINARSLTLGSSVLDLVSWQMLHANLTFNCGTSTINLVSNFEADGMVTENYYDVNFTSPISLINTGLGSHSGSIQFHNVIFAGSGKIMGNNVFSNILTLAAGKTYELENGRTQTIGSVFNATGTCNTTITIRSYSPGVQATISKSSGNVTVNYVSLKDIRATGGGVFTANNTVDLGNNTGWTINTVSPQNLYWVGGSGNWNDQAHWSTTSGGAGGACIPTAYNDVFFDGGSGFTAASKTVTINVAASCRSMDWTGAANNPVLTGGVTTLEIYGSLKMIPAMSVTFGGAVYFEATSPGHTITMGGKSFNQNVYFEGAGGGWTFLDAFQCGNLNLVRGALNTNNQPVNSYSFYSLFSNPRSLTLGSSVLDLVHWQMLHANATFNGGTATMNLSGSFEADGMVTANYYDVNFINAASSTASGIGGHGGTIQFHNVIFAGSGRIQGNNVFANILTMAAGKTYELQNGRTQTIQNRWNVQGSCVSYIHLKSSNNGVFASVSKAFGDVLGFNIHMQDIHAVGGSIFNAYNSTDLGGNTGWNFTTLPPLSNAGTITGPATVCAGQTGVVYHLSPTPGAISYNWTVPPGATITSNQGDTIITVSFVGASSGNVTVTASSGCATSVPSILPVTVTPGFVPTVTIATGSTTVCAGTSVTFTASPTNEGASPVYQWKVNGINAGTNSPSFTTSSLLNGDQVNVILTSSLSCASPPAATSNVIIMTVTAAATPAVGISANPAGTVCAGTPVTFTATPVNTGGGTVNYDFKVNGSSVQSGSSNVFTSSTLINGNTVRCDMTISGGGCLTATSAISNTISMLVTPAVTPAVGISASPSTTVCTGTLVTFTATAGNTGGGTVNYNFKVNGSSVQSGSVNTFTTATLTSGNTVECEINIAGGTCLTVSNASSNIITMTVGNPVTPTVGITANPGNTICSGAPVTFTANAGNAGGGAINYNFKVNGASVQSGALNTFTTSALTNGNTVECQISISGGTCLAASTAQSNIITMTVGNTITPTVSITANPGNSICSGTPVIFTAAAAGIGGGTVNYDFKINGTSVQSGPLNTFAITTLINGNTVTCEISISGGTCLAASTAQSNIITMSVGSPATPTVSMIANPGSSICSGTTVTFTAGAAGIGGGTLQYDFRINGTIVQSGVSNTFVTSTLVNSDIVDCSILISSGTCISSNIAMSNTIVMQVNPNLAAAVMITANPAGTTCSGVPITFSAASINGGSSPAYQWQLNGVPTGTNSSTFTSSSLLNGDIVHVVLSSNAACVIPATVISNPITVSVSPVLTASVNITSDATTICPGATVTFNATPLNGGSAPIFQWKVNGLNVGTNSPVYINNQLKQGDLITCNMTANTPCSGIQSVSSNSVNMTVKPVPVISFDPADPSTLPGNPVQLKAIVQGSISSYLWTPATTLSNSTISNPVASPRTTTTYNLHVVSQDNCVADKTITVLVYNDIYIPNSFTPDNNRVNDIFKIPPGTSLILQSFSIYDRYGNEVFRTSNINEGWNGIYRGARSPMGTYTYMIKGSSRGMPVLLQGTVILLR